MRLNTLLIITWLLVLFGIVAAVAWFAAFLGIPFTTTPVGELAVVAGMCGFIAFVIDGLD